MTQQSNVVDLAATAGSGYAPFQVKSFIGAGGFVGADGRSTGPSCCPICQCMYFNTASQLGTIITSSSMPLDAQFPHLCFREGPCATRECPTCHWMVPGGVHSAERCEYLQSLVSSSKPPLSVSAASAGEPPSTPPMAATGEMPLSERSVRRFVLTWDHARIAQHPDKYRVDAVEGVLFTSGHVVVDIPALFGNSSCFASMEQLTGYYAKRGTVIVEWLDSDED